MAESASPAGEDKFRAEMRESLQRPKLSLFPLMPLFLAGALIVGLMLSSLVKGIFGGTLLAASVLLLSWITRWGGKRGVSLAVIEDETRRYEATLNQPVHAAVLSRIEMVVYPCFALAFTPAVARAMLGPDAREVGMGGVIFLLAAVVLNMILALSFALFLNGYVRDAYLWRWLLNLGVVGMLIASF